MNVTRKAVDSGCGAADPAVRESVETIALMINLFAPYTAAEMWDILGHESNCALVEWRDADSSLLVADEITVAVQVDGKVRDRLVLPADVSEEDALALALDADRIKKSVGEREIVKTFVRLPRIISIATKG